MSHTRLRSCVLAAALALACAAARGDVFTVTLDPAVADRPLDGRLVLFFAGEDMPGWRWVQPMDGPFFASPQPIASVPVTGFAPGESRTVGKDAVAFPAALAQLDGRFRVQAILVVDDTERCHTEGPGNLHSPPVEVTLGSTVDDEVSLVLDTRIEAGAPPVDRENLRWIRLDSPLLSAHYGRTVQHRAGVVLPRGYLDPAMAERRWPTIYVIPGYGGRDTGAAVYAELHRMRGVEDIAPRAVHVVLDPESPLGHHGFVDSPNHGPRGTALVQELIPHLEETFRLDARPEARIVTGHSSGGWSSLWLVLRHPETFGACWSTAPDPVDFSAFQLSDLYHDKQLYVDGDGADRPSYRKPVDLESDRVLMTVREEALMEHAIDPGGASGQQWDAWEAMFSPRDPATCLPRPMFDPRTGRIDPAVVEQWRKFDIAALVSGDWEKYGPVMTERVRLACGTRDDFYLNRAVERLDAIVRERRTGSDGPGYVMLVEGATHDNLRNHVFVQWNAEMRAWLEASGYPQ